MAAIKLVFPVPGRLYCKTRAYDSNQQSFDWTIERDVPMATYFVRAYAYNPGGQQVAFGQSMDGQKKTEELCEKLERTTAGCSLGRTKAKIKLCREQSAELNLECKVCPLPAPNNITSATDLQRSWNADLSLLFRGSDTM